MSCFMGAWLQEIIVSYYVFLVARCPFKFLLIIYQIQLIIQNFLLPTDIFHQTLDFLNCFP